MLFNESASRIVISVPPENLEKALALLAEVPHQKLGEVGGDTLQITAASATLSWPVKDLHHRWYHALADLMEDR